MQVFPGRGDRIWCGLSRADGEDHGGESAGDQLVYGESREIIQEMGVVDPHDGRSVVSFADQAVDGFAHPA